MRRGSLWYMSWPTNVPMDCPNTIARSRTKSSIQRTGNVGAGCGRIEMIALGPAGIAGARDVDGYKAMSAREGVDLRKPDALVAAPAVDGNDR